MKETNPNNGTKRHPSNREVAARLAEIADLLERKGENPYKVRAYREGADTIRELGRAVYEIVQEEGKDALRRLPGIGKKLASVVAQLATTGSSPVLDNLRAEVSPVDLLSDVPGVGPLLAKRIHERLGISTLEDLEQAAHDGRLAEVPGMGPRRIRAVRESLAGRLGRARQMGQRLPPEWEAPPVSELLDVDEEYRRLAAADALPKFAPRRFNPKQEAWLPVLRTRRGQRRYVAMYSNTAQAHRRGTTRDWVVIYLRTPTGKDQWTVTTIRSGRLAGARVVRGREKESHLYHLKQPGLFSET